MNYEIGQKYEFYGKVENVNASTYDTYAINVTSETGESLVVRLDKDVKLSLNKIYHFATEAVLFKEKTHLLAESAVIIGEMNLDDDEKERLLRVFYHYAPINLAKVRKGIETKLQAIENPIVSAITKQIFDKYQDDFYMFPAATKFHHAYISGLAYHTHSMLKLADGFLAVYPFLSADLVYAGVILHDVAKILEFDTYEGSEYTVKGRLIGHITMGANLINQAAIALGFQDSEEAMLLEHIMISHHYYGNFGSPKRPNIAEALIIHFLDNIDSKVCVLGEELDLIEIGDSTSPIGVLDRERYYKHKLSKQ